MDDFKRTSTRAEDEEARALARFLSLAGRLKQLPRTGWLDRGVPADEAESVADHSFRVALLAWVAAARDPVLDRNRVLLLALIHDMAEAVTGDLTPYSPEEIEERDPSVRRAFLNQRHIPAAERAQAKRAAEAAAIAEMTELLPEALRSEIRALWQELEARSTPEARFVKQADKLETYLQSLEYKAAQPDLPVDSFASEVAEAVDLDVLVRLREAIRSDRDA